MDFRAGTDKGHGPGELKFVREMELLNRQTSLVGGFTNTYDALVDGERWEVKDVTATNGEIRPGTSASRGYFRIVKRVHDALEHIQENVGTPGVVAVSCSFEFIQDSLEKVESGEISKGRRKKIREILPNESGSKYTRDWYDELWTQNGDPEKIFSNVNGVAILHEKEGYVLLPRNVLGVYMKCERITQRQLRIKLFPAKETTKSALTYENGELERGVDDEPEGVSTSERERDSLQDGGQGDGGPREDAVPDGGVQGAPEVHGVPRGSLLLPPEER